MTEPSQPKAPQSHSFQPGLPDAAGVISWIHIGDLHMTQAGEQNHRDLIAIVETINQAFADSLSFVFLPGDVAEHGSAAEFALASEALARLRAPWCSIIGDHDVHERSFENYLAFAGQPRSYAFSVGAVRFLAMNAFDEPDPGAFCMLPEQAAWAQREMDAVEHASGSAVVLLHCYPTDLKKGGEPLRTLVERPAVRLVEMGHTHYNELANDGRTLYSATRSTGQIEEGAVGYSVTNIDGDVISWKFIELGKLPVVIITSPADERCITDPLLRGHVVEDSIEVRAKAWSAAPIVCMRATLHGREIELAPLPGSVVWSGAIDRGDLDDGVHDLRVIATDAEGREAQDTVRAVIGRAAYVAPNRAERDQDNAIGAWAERGLVGTQLGPNKNGRKW